MAIPSTADVVIVGGGPAGLLTACFLRKSGIDAIVIDACPTAATTSNASIIHLRTLEILEPLGLTEAVLARSFPMKSMDLYSGDSHLTSLDFQGLCDSCKYENAVSMPQAEMERMLAEKLAEFGGVVYRNTTFTELLSNDDDVENVDGRARIAVTDNATGSTSQIESRFVVAADGKDSLLRQSVAIPFDGGSYEQQFLAADLHLRPDAAPYCHRRDTINLWLTAMGECLLIPFPSYADDESSRPLWRLIATVPGDEKEPGSPEQARDYFEKMVLDRAAATVTHTTTSSSPENNEKYQSELPHLITEVPWCKFFRIDHKLARSYRSGRVFLCGDSAHTHAPSGGQGMNTGIQDAECLARVLAQALRVLDNNHNHNNNRKESSSSPMTTPTKTTSITTLLNTYTAIRRPVGEKVVKMTHDLTLGAMLSNPVLCAMRDWFSWCMYNFVPGGPRFRLARQLSAVDN